MLKQKRIALRRRLDGMFADAESLYLMVEAIVAEAYGIPNSRHEHVSDVVAELMLAAPGLCGEVALLRQLGEDKAAAASVKTAVATLRQVDPHLFDPAPSPKLAAALRVGLRCETQMWVSAISSCTYETSDQLRRRALHDKRALAARGAPIPTEADVVSKLGRDAARSKQFAEGGGTNASVRSA